MLNNLRDAELQIEALKRQQTELIKELRSLKLNESKNGSMGTNNTTKVNEVDSQLNADKNTVIHRLLHLFDKIKALAIESTNISVTNLNATNLDLVNPLPISDGGTGASNVTDARTNLDVYSKAQTDTKLSEKDTQIVYASSALSLTTVFADVPGTSITVLKTGVYSISAFFDLEGIGLADAGAIFLGSLNINGSPQTSVALKTIMPDAAFTDRITIGQNWYFILSAGAILKLQGRKTGGTGTSIVNSTHTSLYVQWQR